MSYTIQYGSSGKLEDDWNVQYRREKGHIIKRVLLCILGLAFLISLKFETVQNFLIPGDAEVTKAAFFQFTEDIQSGEQFKDAVYTFCREIIDHAEIPE